MNNKMTRRELLKTSAVVVTGGCLGLLGLAQPAATAKASPTGAAMREELKRRGQRGSFTFVVVTDSHVDARPEATSRPDGSSWHKMLWSQSPRILSEAVREINARNPDFVVHCGDFTDRSDKQSFVEGARIMNQLRMPFYFVPGNHDTYEAGAREHARSLLGLCPGPFYRAEYVGEWRLILLDTVYWLNKDRSVSEEFDRGQIVDIAVPQVEMNWLRAELARDSKTPTLCFTHAVMAVRESYPIARQSGYAGPWDYGFSYPSSEADASQKKLDGYLTSPEVSSLLKEHPCVKGVFYGHGHFHDCIIQSETLFCQTGALIEYPVEMRLVRVFPDRLETEVFGLSNKEYAKRSYVEGKWANDWMAGRDVDRHSLHVF